jgi:hypothetical protein
LFNPAFHHDVIEKSIPVFIEKANLVIQIMEKEMTEKKSVNVVPWMSRFTLDSLGKGAFGWDFHSLTGGNEKYWDAYHTVVAYP